MLGNNTIKETYSFDFIQFLESYRSYSSCKLIRLSLTFLRES